MRHIATWIWALHCVSAVVWLLILAVIGPKKMEQLVDRRNGALLILTMPNFAGLLLIAVLLIKCAIKVYVFMHPEDVLESPQDAQEAKIKQLQALLKQATQVSDFRLIVEVRVPKRSWKERFFTAPRANAEPSR